ncbi:hypothetical protein [Thermococcus sp.]|uniref:hypothetical protein n=1 Tax=Thermococcus sp. TaxID=35749 RepID=UPI00260F7506|nr:hypothetical protein [Thermococcus sp.]
MKSMRFQTSIFIFFLVGYFFYLKGFYPFEIAFLTATITAILVYLIPVGLVEFVKKKRHDLTSGLLIATIWEFSLAILTRVLISPLWRSFLLAGVGGALTTVFLAFVRKGKEKQNENAAKLQI